MAVLEIVKHPDTVLRQKSDAVTDFDKELKKTVENMVQTMRDAKGIGLAAVQVAITKRILVLDVANIEAQGDDEENEDKILEEAEVYINPEILSKAGETEYEEGCLSIPGVYGMVDRAAEITIRYQDETGDEYEMEADGLRAIALQHEIDHLNGVLFIDHLPAMQRSLILAKYNKLQKEE
ncbi:peptide deformylase [bacterium]|nr:peptide deformylase [bacterium]